MSILNVYVRGVPRVARNKRIYSESINQSVNTTNGSGGTGVGLRYLGAWMPNSYTKDEIVYDGRWTMIAKALTTDRAAPQRIGDEEIIFNQITDTDVSQQALKIMFGTRVTPTYDGFIENYRLKVEAGQKYDIRIVEDSLGTSPVEIQVETFEAETTEIKDFGFIPFFFRTGVTFDITVTVEGDGQGGGGVAWEVFQNYNYVIEGQTDLPAIGEIMQMLPPNKMRINDTDALGEGTAPLLSSLIIGDKITIGNTTYTIDNIAQVNPTVYEYDVTPAFYELEGNYDVRFFQEDSGSSGNINFSHKNNHWLGNTEKRGLYSNIGDYSSIAVNDNGYPIHLTLQKASFSDNWGFVARNSKPPAYKKHSQEGILTELSSHTVTYNFEKPFVTSPMEILLDVYRMELQEDGVYQKQGVSWGYPDINQPSPSGFTIIINNEFTPNLTDVVVKFKFEEL